MNNKILIIYAHPDKDGYNKEILKNTEDYLKKENKDYKLLDLYKMKFNPCLDKEELEKRNSISKDVIDIQKEVKERDTYIFIYPVWWGGMPGILKGFVDRVFLAGFAFKYVNSVPVGLLKGKRALVLTTTGAPKIYNFLTCNRGAKALTRNVLKFCAVKTKTHVFSKALNIEKDREEVRNKVKKIFENYF